LHIDARAADVQVRVADLQARDMAAQVREKEAHDSGESVLIERCVDVL
jgi:hypothetical protein